MVSRWGRAAAPQAAGGGADGSIATGKGWLAPASDDAAGGVAADLDGNVFWAIDTHSGYDRPNPSKAFHLVRTNPRGFSTSMVRYGMDLSALGVDVARVRWRDEPFPAEPGGKTTYQPPDATADAAGGDDATGTAATGTGGSGGGGCTAGGAGGRGAAVAAVLALLVLGVRRRPPVAALAALLVACSGGGGGGGDATADPGAGDGTAADVATDPGTDTTPWKPDVVTKECKGKDLCEPLSGAVCVGTDAHKRCAPDADGCWVWTAPVKCANAKCVDGRCDDGTCRPDCLFRRCGDDGCGGTCGTCTGTDVCCDHQCGPCVRDCAAKDCGADGAGGSCGTCPDGYACRSGKCKVKGTASCLDYHRCVAACPIAGYQGCADDCAAAASSHAKGGATVLGACLAASCFECYAGDAPGTCLDACAQKSCLWEQAACFNENGTQTCSQGYACLDACADGDTKCAQACSLSMSINAYSNAVLWEQCVLPLCPDALPKDQKKACWDTAGQGPCAETWKSCFGPCTPSCLNKVCGEDGCGGSCGLCPEPQYCSANQCFKD